MREYIAFDSHKRYTLAEREDVATGKVRQERIEHQPGAIREYLAGCAKGGSVAVEALGTWYWIVQEIEQAGHRALLVHPRKAKLMMGMINKTDKLDVHGLNRLQRNGTLPTVWIPPGALRDQRELTRTRMVVSQQRTRLKNRITSCLAKYGLGVEGRRDAFGAGARAELEGKLGRLPEHTAWTGRLLLAQLDVVVAQLEQLEERMAQVLDPTPAMGWQRTMPGFGPILSAVVVLEMGEAKRFPDAEHFASYSGTTPRVHSSGGKIRYGQTRSDVNRYLKWAFVEAANVIMLHAEDHPDRHVTHLYQRLAAVKGHAKAIGAVARHLAEATYWVQSLGEPYRDPELDRVRKV